MINLTIAVKMACGLSWALAVGACGNDGPKTGSDAAGQASDAVAGAVDANTMIDASSAADANTMIDAASFVSNTISSAITQQIVPVDGSDQIFIEYVTVSDYPIRLSNPAVLAMPAGFTNVTFAEDLVGAECPSVAMAGKCKQRWQLRFNSGTNCELDGDYSLTFDVGCDSAGNCDQVDPMFTSYQVDSTLNSANFCAPDAFNVIDATLPPISFTDPVEGTFITVTDLPYSLTATSLTFPAGFTLNRFAESAVTGPCPNGTGGCKQRWDVWLNSNGGTCRQMTGVYELTFGVVCEVGGNCDPNKTEHIFTTNFTTNFVCP